MRDMVHAIKRVNSMLGNKIKQPAPGEDSMRQKMRRGVYAASDLSAGHVITENDLICIRPESEYAPKDIEDILGRTLTTDLARLSPISRDCLGS
jgi:sialic acid synthase SpsE